MAPPVRLARVDDELQIILGLTIFCSKMRFGMSEGLHGYILSFDKLVDDFIDLNSKVKGSLDFHTLPSFLFGQSMGGDVALKVHLKEPTGWNGAVLVVPMCKIADDMIPPPMVTEV